MNEDAAYSIDDDVVTFALMHMFGASSRASLSHALLSHALLSHALLDLLRLINRHGIPRTEREEAGCKL